MPHVAAARRPRPVFLPIRVLLITFLLTLLALAVSLLLGIIGIVISAEMRGVAPNMSTAYRIVAFPTAIVVGLLALVASIIVEVRNYRQTKVLSEIERAV